MTSTDRIPLSLRTLVAKRADYRCEYCLMPERFSAHQHEPDHIVPRQHGGMTDENNLALSCMRCNRRKGPNVGSFDPETGELTAFFNPPIQNWNQHFRMEGALIFPLTAQERVTVKILGINDEARLAERELLVSVGLYPE